MQKIYLSLHINCDLSDVSLHDPAGIAHGNAAVRDILHHDAPGSYGYVASDGNPGKDGHGTAYPDIVPYVHWPRPFPAGVPLDGVSAVAGRIDADVRTDETVVADSHRGFIQHREVEVCEETSAHADIASVIAVERLVDEAVPITLSKEAPEQLVPFLQH